MLLKMLWALPRTSRIRRSRARLGAGLEHRRTFARAFRRSWVERSALGFAMGISGDRDRARGQIGGAGRAVGKARGEHRRYGSQWGLVQ